MTLYDDTSTIPIRFQFVGFGAYQIASNTMSIMRTIIIQSMMNLYVRKYAEQITDDSATDMEKVQSIYDWVNNNTRYQQDPIGMEMITTPPEMLRQLELGNTPVEDCDGLTVLSLSLVASLGYRVAIRAVGFDATNKDLLSHVYGLVYVSGQWIPFDEVVAKKGGELGEEPPGIVAVKDMEV